MGGILRKLDRDEVKVIGYAIRLVISVFVMFPVVISDIFLLG